MALHSNSELVCLDILEFKWSSSEVMIYYSDDGHATISSCDIRNKKTQRKFLKCVY